MRSLAEAFTGERPTPPVKDADDAIIETYTPTSPATVENGLLFHPGGPRRDRGYAGDGPPFQRVHNQPSGPAHPWPGIIPSDGGSTRYTPTDSASSNINKPVFGPQSFSKLANSRGQISRFSRS